MTNASPQDTPLTKHSDSQANVRIPKTIGMKSEWMDSHSYPLEKVFFRLADAWNKPTWESLRSVLDDPDLVSILVDKFGRFRPRLCI